MAFAVHGDGKLRARRPIGDIVNTSLPWILLCHSLFTHGSAGNSRHARPRKVNIQALGLVLRWVIVVTLWQRAGCCRGGWAWFRG